MESLRPSTFRAAHTAIRYVQRCAYSEYAPKPQQKWPKHFLSTDQLDPYQFGTLVRTAAARKSAIKTHKRPFRASLTGLTVAMLFSKRSTRTRVSTEAATALMGGHPMFLGKDDIQLGVNESLFDTAKVISSIVSCLVARVGSHSDVTTLAEHSSKPVINALSDTHHPLQTVADILTMHEVIGTLKPSATDLGLRGRKVAWIGDANNVLFDLAIGCMMSGIRIAVASPEGYGLSEHMKSTIKNAGLRGHGPGRLSETTVPEEAIQDADVIVTDTWISMGQESEKAKRLKAFEGFRVTEELAERGGAKKDWKFMHCMPRHQEEVDDGVFYGPRSVIFREAENRLWAMFAVLETFVARGKGLRRSRDPMSTAPQSLTELYNLERTDMEN